MNTAKRSIILKEEIETAIAQSHYEDQLRDRHNGQTAISMHRVIMNTPKGMETDHINGNGLDNRRENLRIVTRRENQQNRHGFKTSKYPGVSKVKNRWTAHIHINKKQNYLGSFKDEEKAARRYRIACDWQVIDL